MYFCVYRIHLFSGFPAARQKPSFSTIYTSLAPCQATRNVIQSYRVEKTAIVSVLADLCVKHRRVASDDWSSLDVALFHFLSCSLFEMGLINYDDQRLRFLVILGNELLRLGQEVDLAGSGEVLHKVFGADTNPVVFHTRRKIVAR